MNDSPIKKKSDLQLTGSNEIDAPLREVSLNSGTVKHL